MMLGELDALVLAGGLGTRLRAAAPDHPKVLAPVAGRPFVTWLLEYLSVQGLRRAVLCTGHAADDVERAVGPRVADLSVRFSREHDPLGTGGALRAALALTTSDPVLVLNGDSLLMADLPDFVVFHDSHAGASASLALAEVPDTADSGRVELDAAGRVASFAEKRRSGPGLVSAGVYLVARSCLSAIPAGRAISLEGEVMPDWIRAGVWGWRSGGKLLDVGTPASYRRAEAFLAEVGLT